MSKAIYAFSADPITFGHIDILERTSKIFDEVVAAIGTNPLKQCLFSTDERVELAKDALKHLHNISVVPFQGLLADFVYESGANVIIRGLRNSDDFNFELMFHQLNESQVAGIETFLIPCKQQLAHISSTAAKALQLEQGLIHEYVPLNVKQKLEERISGQFIIGVTGEIAAGKSYLTKQILELATKEGIQASYIDLDCLAHEILERATEPVYRNFREQLFEKFGEEIKAPNGFIDTAKLGEKIFADIRLLQEFNRMTYLPLTLLLRKRLYHKRGLILLESALLAETDSLFYCNNYVIAVSCSKEEQLKRLKARRYSENKIVQRLNAQFSFDEKVALIKKQIAKSDLGKIFLLDGTEEDAEQIVKGISALLPDRRIKIPQ